MVVEFLKNDVPVNNKKYNKGETLSVSSSISKTLLDDGDAKEYVEPKPKKKSKSSKE